MTRVWLALACALLWSACTNQRRIGSTCENGVCNTASTNAGVPCMVATGMPQISGSESNFLDMCVLDSLHKDSGDMVPCRMFFAVGMPSVTSCEQLGFDVAEEVGTMAVVCEIPQLDRFNRASNGGGFATGWYVEGPTLPPTDSCYPLADQHVRFNGPLPVQGTTWLSCAEAFATPESVSPALRTGDAVLHVAPDSCDGLPPLDDRMPEDIGALCTTRMEPERGFYTNRTYVDLRSEQCESGVCLVDATRASTPWPCPSPVGCSNRPFLDDLTYCSCRCDAKGDTSRIECNCPLGYTCQDVLSADAPSAVAGGYCMRDSNF